MADFIVGKEAGSPGEITSLALGTSRGIQTMFLRDGEKKYEYVVSRDQI